VILLTCRTIACVHSSTHVLSHCTLRVRAHNCRAYYEKFGMQCWESMVVPSFVTSNAFIAQQTARCVRWRTPHPSAV
jgi:hypothetical protein